MTVDTRSRVGRVGAADGPLPTTTDVLVVGAGPTGLALATALGLLDVDVELLDAAPGIRTDSRAAGVQPHTIEDLARLGAADALVAEGLQGVGFRAVNGKRELLSFGYGDLDTDFPFVLLVPQDTTERVLHDALDRAGGRVRRRHRVIGLDPEFDAVTVQVVDPEGLTRTIRAEYVVGCDGLHSGVRTRTGIGFDGSERPQHYLLADAEVGGLLGPPQVTFTFADEGLLLLSPLPGGLMRVVATVEAARAEGGQAYDRDALTQLLRERAPAGATLTLGEISQISPYRVSTRLAERFGDGRVFLAGDAAHVHSPAGGQGMNTGIQDAVNLAWKLAAVLHDDVEDREALLDSYDVERRANAAALLAFTEQLTGLAETSGPQARALRDDVLQAAGSVPATAPFLAGRLSQLDLRYASGPQAHPAVGRRARLPRDSPAGLRWHLVVPSDLAAVAKPLAADSPARLVTRDEPTSLLLRPDGYVAAAADGAGADDLAALLSAVPRPRVDR